MEATQVLNFWFDEIDHSLWFSKNTEFDRLVKERFLLTYHFVKEGQSAEWRTTPEGRLAQVIVLDQFPRNMFRDTPEAFATDATALAVAEECVLNHEDKKIPLEKRGFLYMPYMHSEDQKVHETAVTLFSQESLEENLRFELLHKKIIDRFGRYPHRNKILKRKSTPEEIEFLKESNSSF